MNKKRLLIISIVVVLLVVMGTLFLHKSTATVDSTIFKDQEVDSLSFTDATFEYEKGVSTLKVNVSNKTKEDYTLSTITIKFTQSDGEVIEMIGYVGDVLKADSTMPMTASIDKNLNNSKNLEYVINK